VQRGLAKTTISISHSSWESILLPMSKWDWAKPSNSERTFRNQMRKRVKLKQLSWKAITLEIAPSSSTDPTAKSYRPSSLETKHSNTKSHTSQRIWTTKTRALNWATPLSTLHPLSSTSQPNQWDSDFQSLALLACGVPWTSHGTSKTTKESSRTLLTLSTSSTILVTILSTL
jgi:hypothetical protein